MKSIWQVKIKITQAPQPFFPDTFEENALLEWQEPEIFRTFLIDPIGSTPPKCYGLELCANKKVNFNFFTDIKSEMEGVEIGHAWLTSLKYKFKGLDGKISLHKIDFDNAIKVQKGSYFEIVFPNGVMNKKINIIDKFINLFYQGHNSPIYLYILWQRKSDTFGDKKGSNLYYLRVIFYCKNTEINTKEYHKIRGILKFLSSEIETLEYESAYLKELTNFDSINILKGTLFFKNDPPGRTFNKVDLNFDFPEETPLPKIPVLDNENVRYIDLNVQFIKNSVSFGNHVKNGVLTDHITYSPINKLAQDIAIFGKSGTGKTYFLARLINELTKKAERVGILVLNVAKESQDIYYQNFRKIKYLDKDFHVPYYIEGCSLEKGLQETATYLCASLGLKNVFEKIIYRTMRTFLRLNHRLPEFFIELLIGVEKYVKQNPYGDEVQANLLQALRNRIKVFDEQHIQDVMRLTEHLPEWINSWLKGENIFLDLAMCNKFTKLLIVNAIFQIVRSLMKNIEIEELKYIIVLDEAHAILEKPVTNNSDDADFIMKEAMVKIFSEVLKEYRSRGVGIILADQSPSRLFDDVVSQPSIKIIFREDYPNNILFSESPNERQILTQLPDRIVLVVNGATGEKYLMRTIKFQF